MNAKSAWGASSSGGRGGESVQGALFGPDPSAAALPLDSAFLSGAAPAFAASPIGASGSPDAERPVSRADFASRPNASGPSNPHARIPGLMDGLNPAQQEAAMHGEGPLLILAGPGSGKTRVITRRIAYLATECGVEPWRILAITFTNKAAREMRERVEKMLPTQGMWISTFHAMCARILRREIEVLGGWTRDFTIYDTHDRNQLLKQLIKDSDYDITRFKPSMVGGWISEWKNGVHSREPEAGLEQDAAEGDGIEDEVFLKLRKLYDARLRAQNALDFDDLLLKVHEIFRQHPGVRDAYATRFEYVMVDEYQDTNHVQYMLTRALGSVHGNVAVCGDPDQSIYAWRGADIRNILDFEKDFPNPTVVKLEQNYRSTTTILKAAQSVIEKNTARKKKDLWSEKGEGRKIVLVQCADENDEAREIAHQIQGLQLSGKAPREIAIFYRVNFMQRAIESALRLARVPYQVIGGQEFYERREIRDLVAYAKLVANPADDIAFRRVVNVPGRGVGEKSLEVLAEFAADRRIPLSEAVRSSEVLARIKGRARGSLEGFAALMSKLADLRDQPAGFALAQILEEIGREAWLAEMNDDSGVDREANVDELLSHAEAYDRMVEASKDDVAVPGVEALEGGLRGFLQDIALVSDTDQLADDTNKVTLMTLHSAKGLEFPVVFIAGLEEEILPHVRSIQAAAGPAGESGLEEERRLFYVGITRAEERLFLSHAEQRMHFGEYSFRVQSRFLGEIPPELIEGYEPDKDEEEMLGAFEKPPTEVALAVGDRVEHDHFGRGTIERLQGAGVNARATVHFPAAGTKTLLLQYAKLKVIAKGKK